MDSVAKFVEYIQNNRVKMVHDASKNDVVLEFLAVSHAFGGEAGELQNVVKKIVKQGVFFEESDLHDMFILEAGDALHYLLSLIDLAGYDLEDVMIENMGKLDKRKQAHEAQAALLATFTSEPGSGTSSTERNN